MNWAERCAFWSARPHVGGNSWSEKDGETGIEYHTYGSHLFHTNSEVVWDYLNQFTRFTDYRHHVLTVHAGQVYPMPISLGTICAFFGKYLSPGEARDLIARQSRRRPRRSRRTSKRRRSP